jgi:hypothetical protein
VRLFGVDWYHLTWRVRPVARWPACRCRAGGRPEAARRVGFEFVEKLLTSAMVALLDGAEREHASPTLRTVTSVKVEVSQVREHLHRYL